LARLLVEMVAECLQRRRAASRSGCGGKPAARGSLLPKAVSLHPAGPVRLVSGLVSRIQEIRMELAVQGGAPFS
jgi:hypothetical protein